MTRCKVFDAIPSIFLIIILGLNSVSGEVIGHTFGIEEGETIEWEVETFFEATNETSYLHTRIIWSVLVHEIKNKSIVIETTFTIVEGNNSGSVHVSQLEEVKYYVFPGNYLILPTDNGYWKDLKHYFNINNYTWLRVLNFVEIKKSSEKNISSDAELYRYNINNGLLSYYALNVFSLNQDGKNEIFNQTMKILSSDTIWMDPLIYFSMLSLISILLILIAISAIKKIIKIGRRRDI